MVIPPDAGRRRVRKRARLADSPTSPPARRRPSNHPIGVRDHADPGRSVGGEMKVREQADPFVVDGGGGSAWSRVRSHFSGPASELPDRRRVSDWIRLVVGIVLLIVLVVHHDHETQAEKDIFQGIRDLPHGFDSTLQLFYGLGALWALGLVVVAAVLSERRRLARDLLIAGIATWAIARLIVALVNGTSVARSLDVIVSTHVHGMEFPATRVAMLTAVIAAGGPY